MIQPSFKEFCRLAEQGNLIPVYQELLMDLETPLSFFKRLERDRYSFLLESVEGSERWARYSFLGTRPQRIFKARGKEVEIIENGKKIKFTSQTHLKSLERLDVVSPVVAEIVPVGSSATRRSGFSTASSQSPT